MTQPQKLAKALHACKKQPRHKQAACRKRAQKKYGKHQTTTPTPTVTTPVVPPVTTPAGPTAPPGPTLAWLQQQLCTFASPPCDANNTITNLTMLDTGTPRLGTGVTVLSGGDGVPSDTWIYPLHFSYDQSNAGLYCYVTTTWCTAGGTYTENIHWREKANAQLDAAGVWTYRNSAASTTCDPDPGGCTYDNYGGGA